MVTNLLAAFQAAVVNRCRRAGAHPLAAGLALVAAGALVWQLAQASTIAVTTTADTVDGNTTSIAALLANPGADGKISLREAITAANNDAASGPHTITLPAGTYSHTAGQMAVTAAITLQGAGQASTIINVTGGSRGFTTSNSLTLTGLTLKNAATTAGSGGCILVSAGSLSISNSTLNSCQANNGSNNGGAISMSGTSMTLSSVTVSGNSVNAGSGGGLALNSGTTTITGSTFSSNGSSNNSGGAIWATGSASVSVTDSSFTGNTGSSGGGGIAMASSGTATLTRVTFGANAGANGLGGGLLVSSGTASIVNATFSGNSTNNGGSAVGVSGTGNATLTNVTVASNTTTNGASGLARSAGTLSLTNTIVANNTGGSGNCSGTIVNTGYNLDSGTTCGFGSANHSLSSSNPLLSALASNGGSTQTMALGAGSPAINAGTATGAPTTDQRGASRSGATDIGAYEYGGAVAGSLSVSGTVFEDVNYGGGAGRSLATSSGIGLAGATLELYDSSGNYVASTTSASGGSYSFTSLSAATYYVRVVGGTVASQRSGSTAALAGVMTYRTDASTGTANAVTDNVGGTNPALVDPGAGSSGAAFNTSTFIFSAGLTGTAQSVAPVTLSASNVTGVNFGFNFDTVVNTNDSGAGSLRQAMTNANTLAGDASLAQSGRAAGIENLVFMISNGTAGSGLRSAYNSFSGGVATIAPAAALPDIGSPVVIDAQTQPGWSSAPIIDLNGAGAGSGVSGLSVNGYSGSSGATLRGFVIRNFTGSGINLVSGSGHTVAGNYIGVTAAGTAAAANTFQGVNVYQSGGNTIGGTGSSARNVISGNSANGIVVAGSGATGNVIVGNYVGTNALGTAAIKNGAVGIDIGTSSNTVGGTAAGAGNLISGNTYSGIQIDSGATGNTVQGNTIGLSSSGTALANGNHGVYLVGASNTIGGSVSGAGNVISGNVFRGVRVDGASNTIAGNIIGLNAAGTAKVGNGDGIYVNGAANTTIGGTTALAANTIAGNTNDGIGLGGSGATGTLVRGNWIGSTSSGTAGLGNGGNGVSIVSGASNNTIGGTAANTANTIRNNTGRGISVTGASTGNAIEGNSIYGNTQIGIDLGADGITANDGAKTASQPNLLMDSPVFTSATLSGTTLTIAGYVGSAASQSTFASSRVEVFASDVSSANGSGQTYLGYLTADSSGNFSGSISGVAIGGGSKVTGTATDTGNNSSEFGVNVLVGTTIGGTVFEDVNYGGGAGRSLAASGGSGLAGATVELYNSSGTYVSNTTTATGGSYSFTGLAAGTYYVRAVGNTVASQRTGTVASLVGVPTYSTDASSGTAVSVTDRVGGTNPALADPGAASGGAIFNTSTGVFSAGLSGTAQSFSPVTVSTGSIASIDFGFNFDVVVNTNDSGRGSLRQAITNANTLGGDASLAQSGRAAGIENLVFMVSNGSAGSGLRSTYNYFGTAAGSYNVATIAPTSALPTVSTNLVIDAQTQPGWSANPIIELSGGSAGSTTGLTLNGAASVLRGLVINRFNGDGLALGAAGNTVAGNWIGVTAAGTAAAANTGHGINIVAGGSNTIGGATAASRNVISGNGNQGIEIGSGNSNVIHGNYLGTNAAGTAAVANGVSGIYVHASTGSNTIGGSTAGLGNLVSGNAQSGITLRGGSGSNVIRGNIIGLNAAGSAAIANAAGITLSITGNNNTIGGPGTGDGNIIAGNSGNGIVAFGNATNGNAILGNSIYANGGIGIDLGTATGSAGDGPTINDGTKTTGQPNLWMDTPVFTSASLAGTTLSVAGYVGSAASQSTFAASRVEVFISDASNPSGEGKSYLGFLTTDASGNFSGTISGVSGVTAGSSSITGTATDNGNNTSEFGPNLTVSSLTLTGTVFEDSNYGGGAGRNLAGSGGTGVGGATVELYSSTGSYLASATTASSGGYSFSSVQANTSYFVRVVGSTVASTRSGTTAGLVGVMSYRSAASSGSAVDVTDNVGGTNPGLVDPGAASSGATFNTSSFVYSAGLSGTAQSVAPVTLATTSIGGLDFGFNFDTVVNANDSGAGSLRQAITNANTLGGDASLAQSGRTAAIENIVFMLPNGTAGAGLRSAYNAFAAVSGRSAVATVTLASALPSLSTSLVLDAQTQPGWGGSDTYPVIEINAAAAGANNGITISAGAVTLRGFIVNRAGNEGIKTSTGAGNGITIQGCWVGLNAAGTSSSGYGNAKSGISLQAGNNHVVGGTTAAQRNVVGGSVGNDGISATTGSGHSIRGNYIGVGPTGSGNFGIHGSGVLITGASSTSIIGNVIANAATGINLTGGSNTVQSNIVGADAGNTTALGNSGVGILMSSGSNTIGGTSAGQGNVVRASGGAGVAVTGSVTGNGIQGNSIYGNAGIGIDLGNNGATANDGAKTAGQPNLLMDAPVFTSASISGSTLTVAGYVGSAANQTTFASARVEVFVSDQSNPAGQGQTYLGFLTADSSGNFSGTIGSVSGITPGTTRITGTATDASKNTSEFGSNAVVGVTISGTVYEDVNYGGGAGRGLAAALGNGGSGVAGARVELYDSGGNFVGATTTASSGGYSLPTAASGNYFVRVVGSTVASQRSGSVAALVGVMTWRADASSGTAVSLTNSVGGTSPALVDPGAGSSGTVLDTSSFVFSSGLAGTAQSVSPVAVSSSALAGLDFGFNFDTVVNTNNSGQGSLRQAITNANTLTGDASLAQSGRTAGIENLVFMIPNGSAAAGLRSGISYFSGGVASIAPTSALPTVSSPLVLDAQTQPGWALAPIIELNGSSAGASVSGLTVNAAGSVVRGWVINRFGAAGLASTSGAGLVIQGNYVGTTATGNAAAGNGGVGIFINSTASGHQVGGTAASQGNVVGGNGSRGITIKGGSGHLVQGNRVGVGADGSTAVPNGSFGVLMQAATSNSTVGGTGAGAANLIRGNSRGVQVDVGASGIAILGNSIYGNNGLGINLGAPGPNLNDGAKTPGQPNLLMDTPVFTSATVSGTTLSVAGYVGNAAGETVFANARVEVFISDNAVTGYGEGQAYLGYLTTDASGNFSGTLTGVSGVTNGSTKLTGTATDTAGNTSEFGPDAAVGYAIGGTVFEDANYGGGAGRSLAASGGSGVGGATVEVYDGTGHFVSSTTTSTTTGSAGTYAFAGLAPGGYALRVVGSSVASQRAGSSASVQGVTTYLTDASSSTAVAVTNHVGGTNPALADPGAGSSGTVLNPSTGVFSAGLVGTAQSLAPVTLGAANLNGIDFGFNFDTVVNTNDSGQGSLRQALTNANALGGDAALAQSGRSAGIENLVFMLPNGSASAGLRSGFNAFSGGVATITPASALPTVSTAVVIDAQTQPGWVLNPIVELRGSSAGAADGLSVGGDGSTVRGLIINRWTGNGINVTSGGGDTVQGCWIGLDASGGSAAANTQSGIAIGSSGNTQQIGGTTAAQRNVISGNGVNGVYITAGGNHVISGNYIGTNAAGSAAVGNAAIGIYLRNGLVSATVGGTAAGAGNVVSGNQDGIRLYSGTITVQGNLVGLNAAGTAAVANTQTGIYATSGGHIVGGTTSAARNVVSGNTGRGIWLNAGSITVQGNYVGTNAAGTAAVPNLDGIYAKGTNNLIGGTASGAGNLVSGNGNGILLAAEASGSTVQGNAVGLNAAGTATLPNAVGVNVFCSAGCAVGGTAGGAGNVVAGNSGAGVQVGAGSAGNAILANSIYGNGGIGIDLGADGITANDGAKTGGAANLLMDSPVFASAHARGNQIAVAGYIGTAAGQSVFSGSRIEVFLSDSTSPNGSGKAFLGALTADASGNFSGTITLAASVIPAGSVLTATATDTSGNTSEFGANFASLVVDLVVNSNADGEDASPGDGICQTATANECTLRAALTELNALAAQSSPPTIVFAIPGCTSGGEPACVITPASNLPAAARAVSVDASTQTGYAGTPMIEVNGGIDLAGTPAGLQLTVSGSSARGLRFAGWNTASAAALLIANADNAVVEANWFGLNAAGSATAASANRIGIVLRYANGARIGGATSAQRNVISNSSASGIYLYGGSGASVLGNYVGTDASGNAAAGNAIGIANDAAATVIGGTGSGAGNLFAGNTTAHVSIDTNGGAVANASATVQGNRFGLAAGGAVIGSANDAVWVGAGVANSVIGGTAAGAGNVITGSLGQGIGVVASAGTQVTIEGNSIYGNALLGIDLGRDGVSANDGAYNAAAANSGIDFPVITAAGYDPGTGALTVTGYVGTGTGQAAFANARVEFFSSDGDASGYGEGTAFLGTLTTDTSGHFNGSMTVPAGVAFAVGTLLTGTATDVAGNTSEFGPNFTTTTVGAMSPSRFNAFETSTAAGALVGVLQTRVAGTASSVAVIALDATGAALQTGFTGTVTLSWMQASDNSGALDAGNCRSTWIVTGGAGSAGSMSFAAGDAGRHSGTVTPTTVGREWRLRISYTAPSGTTITACSTDAFAVRPASIAITAISDTDDATAGTVRALDNLSTTGGRVHRAGRPFSLRAAAQDAGGAIATGYDGTPALAITGCVLPASGCVAGTLSVPALLASGGAIATDTLSYSEVGAIALQLTDDNFAAIDAADTPLAQRRIQSSVVGVGRFEPDHYLLAAANTPQFATQQGSCAQTGQGFTFVGQSFGWTTAPAFTVTAQNATGATTLMWAGALQRLTPAGGIPTPGIAASNAQGLIPTATWGTTTLSDAGNGVARVAMAGDQFLFSRDPNTPVASFNPLITISIAVSDTSELGTSGNQPVTASSVLTIGSGTGIGFDQGSTFDYARLKLQNAFGDVRYGVSANVELQKFTARGWLRLAEDNNCVSIPQPAIAFSAGSGAFASAVCAAPAAAPIVLNQGRGTLVLPRIAGNVQGAAQLTLNIGPTLEGSACAAGVPVQPTSAVLAHLLGARGTGSTQDQNPAARLVWGRQHRDYIAQRELF